MNAMELKLQRELLKYAVQRSIFNRDGSVADVRRSVLVQVSNEDGDPAKGATQLFAGADFDANVAPLFDQLTPGAIVEVWDGRRKGDAMHYLVTATPAVSPDQTSLF
jgi:hypothetical protein